LLRGTALSVLDVAIACGFASPSHFSRVYRSAFGRSPARERSAATDLDLVAEGRRVSATMMSS
jgi:transcriptional regulator GlxA family with amidase domain